VLVRSSSFSRYRSFRYLYVHFSQFPGPGNEENVTIDGIIQPFSCSGILRSREQQAAVSKAASTAATLGVEERNGSPDFGVYDPGGSRSNVLCPALERLVKPFRSLLDWVGGITFW
jgi:hypothetical protein